MGSCTSDFCKSFHDAGVMKADFRISVKDNRRNKNLRVLLMRTPYASRSFFVRRNAQRWPADGRPVSPTRILTALCKSLVKAAGGH